MHNSFKMRPMAFALAMALVGSMACKEDGTIELSYGEKSSDIKSETSNPQVESDEGKPESQSREQKNEQERNQRRHCRG